MKEQTKAEQIGTEEGNRLIAEFMGLTRSESGMYNIGLGEFGENLLRYNKDWDKLMPVVEKIESLGFQFFIHNEGAYMRKWHYKGNFPDFGNVGTTKIEAVHQTVVEFIKWYNQNYKQNGK